MSATGLDVFDKTLQTTNIWLDEIMATLGPDRQVAWHVLGAVLHALRDRLQIGLAVHLGAQLPQDRDAVELAALQPDIENDQGRLPRLDRRESLAAVAGLVKKQEAVFTPDVRVAT